MKDWSFDQAPDVAAVTCQRVIAGSPILVVVHYADDHSWAFLSGERFDASDGLLVAMKTIVELDPTITSISDLPPGWIARRESVTASWVSAFDPDC